MSRWNTREARRVERAPTPARAGRTCCASWVKSERLGPCVSRYNRFALTPLPDPPSGDPRWTCLDLTGAEARLFPRASIATPTRCETENLGDSQP